MSHMQIVHTSSGKVYVRRRHEYQSGRYLRAIAPCSVGSSNPQAKMNEETALAIFHATGKHELIAAQHGVSASTVSKIKLKKAWAHIHLAASEFDGLGT